MEIKVIKIEKPEEVNVIVGQAHFIKTVEDLHEALVTTVPGIKFGIAFVESSGARLIRHSGTDEKLKELAVKNAMNIGAGHSFVILLGNAYPINVLRKIKDVDEVVHIYAASANPLEIVVGETELGRAILGVVDGGTPLGVENDDEIKVRKEFLRKIGYKF
ncbi:MAG: adenosine-specific kinase [Candidatus Hydrothermae bacterium]|nr:adenosine-specific kinase [Candidatus Hydrothermae bacterium]